MMVSPSKSSGITYALVDVWGATRAYWHDLASLREGLNELTIDGHDLRDFLILTYVGDKEEDK